MARSTRGRRGPQGSSSSSQQNTAATTTAAADIDPRAESAPDEPGYHPTAVAEPVTGATIVGMPRDPALEDVDDAQEAHIPSAKETGKPAKDGNIADAPRKGAGGGGGMIGKVIPGSSDKDGNKGGPG